MTRIDLKYFANAKITSHKPFKIQITANTVEIDIEKNFQRNKPTNKVLVLFSKLKTFQSIKTLTLMISDCSLRFIGGRTGATPIQQSQHDIITIRTIYTLHRKHY